MCAIILVPKQSTYLIHTNSINKITLDKQTDS